MHAFGQGNDGLAGLAPSVDVDQRQVARRRGALVELGREEQIRPRAECGKRGAGVALTCECDPNEERILRSVPLAARAGLQGA